MYYEKVSRCSREISLSTSELKKNFHIKHLIIYIEHSTDVLNNIQIIPPK